MTNDSLNHTPLVEAITNLIRAEARNLPVAERAPNMAADIMHLIELHTQPGIESPQLSGIEQRIVEGVTKRFGRYRWPERDAIIKLVRTAFTEATQEKVRVKLDDCAAASHQACVNHYNGKNDPLNNPMAVHTDVAKAVLDAAGVPYDETPTKD